MKPYRILVAFPRDPLRSKVVRLLEEMQDIIVVAQASDAVEVLLYERISHPDMIILDTSFPSISGSKLASVIRQIVPDTKLLFVARREEGEGTLLSRVEHGYSWLYEEELDLSLPDVVGRFVSEKARSALSGRVTENNSTHLSDEMITIPWPM